MDEVRAAAPSDLIQQVDDFFGDESPLQRASEFGGRPYEERPQQREMAHRIAECLSGGKHLFVEAPTGVGKSFAYLIPAVFLAEAMGKPVVVSTHTIALQEQLIHKDIPLLRKILDRPIKAALAKGRQNYLCVHRLGTVQADTMDFLPSLDLAPELSKISRWAENTRDGSLADLNFKPSMQVWQSICSESGVCPRDQKKHDECFFQKSRRRLHTADIIVANHAMLCVDLAMRREAEDGDAQGLLPDYCAVVIDEAHTFEGVAANHLGLKITTIELYLTLNRLLHPRNNRGILSKCNPDVRAACTNAQDHCKRFFDRLLDWLADQDENPLVYEHAGHIPNLIAEPLTELTDKMKETIQGLPDDSDIKGELKSLRERIDKYRESLDMFLNMELADSVYWFERYGRDGRSVRMNALPVEIGPILSETLFNNTYPVVLTTATMAVDNRLTYFKERVGCLDGEELMLDTPFDFERQVDLYLPESPIPDPRDRDQYAAACCTHIKDFIRLTEGKAFVLFTSYSTMNTCADLIADFFDEHGYRLLVQGREHQRSKMLDIFRKDTNSVIFGTDSFWMGVDVPGEALSNVILTRLPFPVPSHPLIEAICKRIEAKGMSSFRHYSLPEAVLKFRQGCGRLIRSLDDHGIIAVIDPRIVTKSYGRTFVSSLPRCTVRRF